MQRIWHHTPDPEEMNRFSENTLVSRLGIRITTVGPDHLVAEMPVDHRTRQPLGLLHGGASVVLAETLASVAAYFTLDSESQTCVGLEINANHIRSVREGMVIGTCRPHHLGKSTQVWEVRITNEQGELVCISRVTMAVLAKG